MVERNFPEKTAKYKLSSHCKFIVGAKKAAIYDLEKGNVYSLNESARDVIESSSNLHNFWNRLEEMGLAESSLGAFPQEIRVEIPQVGLEFMWLELTNRCNARCIHCYASAESLPADTSELSQLEWERIIEQGAVLGCKQLQFIGGEPLLYKGIFDLAQAAKDSDFEFIEIFTNGTLLNEKKINKIKDLGISVAISFYSVNSREHEGITQLPGSFEKTARALKMLKEAGIPTRVGIIVMRQNENSALETQNKLQEMGFDSVKLDVLRPTGRGSCGDLLPRESTVQTLALITEPNFSTSREQFYRNRAWNSCWAGKIAITADGGIMPCIFARNHIVENVEHGLGKAVNSDKLQRLWKISKDQVKGCQRCEFRYACHDCRPLAEDTIGDFYAKNPRCMYNPLKGKWPENRKERR